MKALFENTDLFSHKISFNYRKKKVYHSFFGIGLSCILYLIMIFLAYYFSKDFINNTNPKINYRETQFDSHYEFPIKKLFNKVELKVRIDESLTSELDNSELEKRPWFNQNFAALELVSHNRSSITSETIKIHFSYKRIIDYDCMQGTSRLCKYMVCGWDSDNMRIINYTKSDQDLLSNNSIIFKNETIPFNENTKINFTADPNVDLDIRLEFVKDYLLKYINLTSDVFLNLEINDNIIDSNNPAFFKEFNNLYQKEFSPAQLGKELEYHEFSYKMVKVKDDRGFIFSNLTEKVKFQKDYVFSKYNKNDNLNGVLLASISFDKVMKNYDRVYIKLQNIIADIGGIFNSLLLFGNIIIFQFNNKKFNYDMINYLFEANEEQMQNEKVSRGSIDKNIKYDMKDRAGSKYPNDFSIISNDDHNLTNRKINSGMQDNSNGINNLNNRLNENSSQINLNLNFKSIYDNNKYKVFNNNDNKLKYQNQVMLNSFSLSKNKDLESLEDKILEEKINDYFKYKKQSKRKFIKFSRTEFIKLSLCCRSLKSVALQEKEKIFNLAENKIKDYLDILTYSRFQEEFEKLKSVIFDQYQLNGFGFSKSKKIGEIIKIDFAKEVLECVKHYRKKVREDSFNDLDRRLFQSFNQVFLTMINA